MIITHSYKMACKIMNVYNAIEGNLACMSYRMQSRVWGEFHATSVSFRLSFVKHW